MNNRKILGTGTVVIALILSIVSVTIAFAAYNSDLRINGSATTKGTHWSIIFSDLETAVTGNNRGIATTAEEIAAPSISGETAIGDYEVKLETPGDYISYNFRISNTGDFAAIIDSSFVMPTPNCTKGTNGKNSDVTNVCDNLEYTLKYVTEGTNGEVEYTNVQAGDTLASKESKLVQLKLYYKKEAASSDSSTLPFDDVAIDNLNILIPFRQQ